MRNLLCLPALALAASAVQAEPVAIDGGTLQLRVLLGDSTTVSIAPFRLDATPVTNADFAAFVAASPRWGRDAAPSVFRDAGYLQALATAPADYPITHVSWFAASAYCAAQGGRLPTQDEWEYVAHESTHLEPDTYAAMLFAYYADPASHARRAVGAAHVGRWGVHDMHGLVLEWVEDFQMVAKSSTGDSAIGASCGDTARYLADNDPAHYVTFLRYQSRSNYTPRTTTSTLGFRCAYDIAT
ncbi:MAG: formylglycine-generating enzyme family protein [Gammaproteobacteria bacterium]